MSEGLVSCRATAHREGGGEMVGGGDEGGRFLGSCGGTRVGGYHLVGVSAGRVLRGLMGGG